MTESVIKHIGHSLELHDTALRTKQSMLNALRKGRQWAFSPEYSATLKKIQINLHEAASYLEEACDAVSMDEVARAIDEGGAKW